MVKLLYSASQVLQARPETLETFWAKGPLTKQRAKCGTYGANINSLVLYAIA